MQALTNVLADLDEKQGGVSAFPGAATDIDWNARNPQVAAHEAQNDWLLQLEELGFDSAQTNDGYGRALDFVLDKVIESLWAINELVHNILDRE